VSCTFCRVISWEISAHIVLEEDDCVAFLDHRPLFHGHCLLVPRLHVETLADLPGHLVAPLFGAAQRLQLAIETGLGADGVLVAINNRVSQSVPHLHVHLIPRRRGDGLKGFFWPRRPYPDDDSAAAVSNAIRAALRDIRV
jgi:histidine triad (HIT) family protein